MNRRHISFCMHHINSCRTYEQLQVVRGFITNRFGSIDALQFEDAIELRRAQICNQFLHHRPLITASAAVAALINR